MTYTSLNLPDPVKCLLAERRTEQRIPLHVLADAANISQRSMERYFFCRHTDDWPIYLLRRCCAYLKIDKSTLQEVLLG